MKPAHAEHGAALRDAARVGAAPGSRGVVNRREARLNLRSRTNAIVTKEAAFAFIAAVAAYANGLAQEMADAVEREAAARTKQGLAHRPQMRARHVPRHALSTVEGSQSSPVSGSKREVVRDGVEVA